MKRILVGIDFHDETKFLVEKAAELARALGGKLWLLHVAAPEPDFVGYEVGPQYIRDFRARELKKEHRLLMDYVDLLRSEEVEAEGLLIQGETIEVVLEESEKLKIDLIIFGHHDHGFLYTAFFGDNSTRILRHSRIPVLVVPFEES